MRYAEIARKTGETDIRLKLNLDEKLNASSDKELIDSGCGFLNHMLELFAVHSGYGVEIFCRGDVDVDFHHTAEDIAIALGQAFKSAIGDKRGIGRYADIILPMDEALILCAVDISGRGYLNFDVEMPSQKVSDDSDEIVSKKVGLFDSELVEEFFMAFAREAGITLHFKKIYGKNTHHIIEGVFKAFARCLKSATKIVGGDVPSSKGVL